jgi:hypothetical protein
MELLGHECSAASGIGLAGRSSRPGEAEGAELQA